MKKQPKLIIVVIFGVLLLAGLVFYGYRQSKDLMRGPEIQVYEPINGTEVEDPMVEIKGMASRVAFINLNGRQIFVNESGEFSEKLLLAPGYNIIKLSGKDKFGKTTNKLIEVIFNSLVYPSSQTI